MIYGHIPYQSHAGDSGSLRPTFAVAIMVKEQLKALSATAAAAAAPRSFFKLLRPRFMLFC